jgi:hypothetical protein
VSKLATLESDVLNIGSKIKAGLAAAEGDAVKMASFLETNAPEINALASLAGPGAIGVTNTALSVLNVVITAVKGAGAAGAANGLNVSLDAALIAEVKAVLAGIEKI